MINLNIFFKVKKLYFSIMILNFFSPSVSTLLHTKTYTSGILVYAPLAEINYDASQFLTIFAAVTSRSLEQENPRAVPFSLVSFKISVFVCGVSG